jgi:hypothetical protein
MATTPNFHRRVSDRPLYLLAAVIVPLIVHAARTHSACADQRVDQLCRGISALGAVTFAVL